MCGIAGFSIGKESLINPTSLALALFDEIRDIGLDASGAAWFAGSQEGCVIRCIKHQANKQQFKEHIANEIAADVSTLIMHTRRATKGSSAVSANNHPLNIGAIYGIHAGDVLNDEEIISLSGHSRVTEVDSEAIWRLIIDSDPQSFANLKRLTGEVTIAWLNEDIQDKLHLARLVGQPMAICQTTCGATIFANNKTILENIARKCNLINSWLTYLGENTYVVINNGMLIDAGSL